jgi:hypothetical protein
LQIESEIRCDEVVQALSFLVDAFGLLDEVAIGERVILK